MQSIVDGDRAAFLHFDNVEHICRIRTIENDGDLFDRTSSCLGKVEVEDDH